MFNFWFDCYIFIDTKTYNAMMPSSNENAFRIIGPFMKGNHRSPMDFVDISLNKLFSK